LKLIQKQVVYGKEGEHETPYLTRWKIGRLRFHIFHRGDADPDLHDHPWRFWTFPLTPYVEQTQKGYQVVDAFRLHFRPASHAHRVVARVTTDGGPCSKYVTPVLSDKPIYTIVWVGKKERDWGFHVEGRRGTRWIPWREYIFGAR